MYDWSEAILLITAGGALLGLSLAVFRRLHPLVMLPTVAATGRLRFPATDDLREIEGRIHAQIDRLDALILEADEEIQRLSDLLKPVESVPFRGEIDVATAQRVLDLFEAGRSPVEIARVLGLPEPRVRAVLSQWDEPGRQAA